MYTRARPALTIWEAEASPPDAPSVTLPGAASMGWHSLSLSSWLGQLHPGGPGFGNQEGVRTRAEHVGREKEINYLGSS